MDKQLEALDFIDSSSKCTIVRTKGVDEPSEIIRVDRQSEISVAKLLGVVTIDETGHVSGDVVKPGVECWFHFDCTGNAGATFNIITNGEKWLPISRRSGKVSLNMRPKRSVNLKQLSNIDKGILLHAIHAYISRF